jgi:hypothetical protein
MPQMPFTYLLCIIANDAAPGDEARDHYTGVGANFKKRFDFAFNYPITSYSEKVVWMFGAGTDVRHLNGQTLSAFGQEYLKRVHPNPDVKSYANISEYHYYGTLEEMAWMVKTALAEGWKPSDVEFVFFTQRRHMWRVKFIWHLFHKKHWGKAKFVVAGHTRQISFVHELGGLWKVWRVYRGKELPRHATPYSTLGRSVKIEC